MDETTGWLLDFGDITAVVEPIIRAELDHRSLNDVPGLENPTAEMLCRWLWRRLLPHFDGLAAGRGPELAQQGGGDTPLLPHEGQEQVLGEDLGLAFLAGLVLVAFAYSPVLGVHRPSVEALMTRDRFVRGAAAFGMAASFLGLVLVPAGSHAQNVVTEWNANASATIVANGGKPSTASGVWFAYTSIAVYDAVNAIHHRFRPFYYEGSAPGGASDEAAAIAAAHRILVTYFPAQQAALDARFSASSANITAAPAAKAAGITVGEAAAEALIAARANDGLEASVVYTPGSGPGVWQPTPPKFLPALTPWLGQMRPFTMTRASQFLP